MLVIRGRILAEEKTVSCPNRCGQEQEGFPVRILSAPPNRDSSFPFFFPK